MPTADPEEALFAAVLDKPTRAERAAFLDGACGEDRALKARLEALLAAHEGSGGVLDAPPADLLATASYRPLTEGPGTVIGPYKLLQQIGEGGMGVVYMAEQLEPVRRKVALKIIKPGMDSRQVIARFEAERQALAMMDHQNIARVLDAGTTPGEPGCVSSGRPYFVMELVHGVPITQFCDDNKLTPRERLALFVPVCQAIQHAHQKGVIHRDIKPSNVLVTMYDDKPVPKVIDFGVAKAIEQRLTEKSLFTEFGALVGTFEYMSPEQAEMNAFGVDTRSDIYSLGVLLYELLTGTTPLERTRLRAAALDEMVRLIKEEEAPRPSVRLSTSSNLPKIAAARKVEPAQLSKLVRGELDWIVMKCLEKDRTRRYEAASGLAKDVERHLADEPVEACPPSAGYRLRKFARKYSKSLATAAAFVLLLVSGVVASTLLAVWATSAERQAIRERAVAEAARAEAEDARVEASKQRDEARATAYANGIGLAQRAWDEENIVRARELLDEVPREAAGRNLPGFEWDYLARLCHAELRTLPLAKPVSCVALSPDGRHAASGSEDGLVHLWDIEKGEELLLLKGHSKGVGRVAFSPDGHRLASGDENGTVKLWNIKTGKELLTLVHPSGVRCAAFSPDGRRLATGGGADKMKVWDSTTGKELLSLGQKVPIDKGFVGFASVAFSPDGRLLAAGVHDNTVRVWDSATGKELFSREGHTWTILSVAFSPDGKRLASASSDDKVKLWDIPTGKELLSFEAHSRGIYSVAFSPNGQQIATACENGTVKLWDSTTGKRLASLQGHTGAVTSVAFSPSGQRLVSGSADDTVKIWAVATAQEPFSLGKHDFVHSVVFSPDGRRLASGGWGRTVQLWDSVTGKELHALGGVPVGPDGIHTVCIRSGGCSVAFSPDGRRLTSASGNEYKTVLVWDAATGKELLTLEGHTKSVPAVAFSPDGQHLATGSEDGTVKIWDGTTGKELLTLTGHKGHVNGVAFRPDGRRLASGSSDDTVKLWDCTTGKELLTLKGHSDKVLSVAFSPDGRRLASGSKDGTAKVWDGDTGKEFFTFRSHAGCVYSVAFSSDSRRLASGSEDGTVKVWDSSTGKELLSFKDQGGMVLGVAFRPSDGRCLASAHDDGSLRLWESDVAPEARDRRAAESLVADVFREKGLRADVLDWLQNTPELSAVERKEALAVAQAHPEKPALLIDLAWQRVKTPGRELSDYRQALRYSEAACLLEPKDANYVTTLGVAHYRIGNDAKAVEMLLRADQFKRPTDDDDPVPACLAFLAMARHRLGQAQEAQAVLQRLREYLKDPRWVKVAEAQGFLREAETLLAKPTTAGDK